MFVGQSGIATDDDQFRGALHFGIRGGQFVPSVAGQRRRRTILRHPVRPLADEYSVVEGMLVDPP
jgi:hypothetical protein